MKKKVLVLMVALMSVITASAQFEKGKVYVGGSLTGLNMNYSGDKFRFGAQANVGYFIADDFLLHASAAYEHNDGNAYGVGAGARYYIEQNGIFLGLNCKFHHAGSYNDVMPGLEVGYAFFLSHSVTVEPSIYYDQSIKSHKDYSTVGLKLGVGVYLFKD